VLLYDRLVLLHFHVFVISKLVLLLAVGAVYGQSGSGSGAKADEIAGLSVTIFIVSGMFVCLSTSLTGTMGSVTKTINVVYAYAGGDCGPASFLHLSYRLLLLLLQGKCHF
jgi:hypothetical protein